MSQEILAAIEASNKAFADFKTMNEQRLAALEKANPSRGDELSEAMRKAFDEMRLQKEIIERLEAKLNNRPLNGGSGDSEKDAAIELHRTSFKSYIRKGIEFDKHSLEPKALDITNSAEGGYAVPKVIDAQIEALVVNISPIRALASIQQISTSDFHKLVNLRGTASGWVTEMAARPETTEPTLADVVPPMGDLYANPYATQQMLDDVFFNAEAWLADNVATEFARNEANAFCVGNGTAKPKGFLSYTNVATGDATRTFGQIEYYPTGAAGAWPTVSATVNQTDVLIALLGKLKKAYRGNAQFLCNKATLFTMAAFKDNTGRYIFNPMSAPNIPMTLLGYPIIEAEDMPDVAANSLSVAVADWKRAYLIVDRVGIRILRDPFSAKPYITFYTVKRLGGAVVNSEAIKLLKFSVS
jgi:HK97 family phage major capsid protein